MKIRGHFHDILPVKVDVRHSKAESLGRRSPSKVTRSASAPDILDHTNPFATILDLAPDAIIAVNRGESIVFFNRSAEATFGYLAEEIRAKPLKLLFPDRLAGFHEIFGKKAWGTPEWREIMGQRKDGSEFPAKLSQSKIEFDGETILSLTVQNATSQAFIEGVCAPPSAKKKCCLKKCTIASRTISK